MLVQPLSQRWLLTITAISANCDRSRLAIKFNMPKKSPASNHILGHYKRERATDKTDYYQEVVMFDDQDDSEEEKEEKTKAEEEEDKDDEEE